MNKWFGTTGETTSGYGFTSVFDLSKNAIVSHAAFKIDCIFDLFSIKVLFFFPPHAWIFCSSETRWQKSESCPYSLYSCRQAIAYFINDKGTPPGLQNSFDILSWWCIFIKNTCWKQSVLINKGRWAICFPIHTVSLTVLFVIHWYLWSVAAIAVRCCWGEPQLPRWIKKEKTLWDSCILWVSCSC